MNFSDLVEKVTGDLSDKKRYREYRERVKNLPSPYRASVQALERYLTYFGGITRGDVLVRMLDDLATLFEQGAADGTEIRSIVGDDPVGFADDFLANYAETRWINGERARLVAAIDEATAQDLQ